MSEERVKVQVTERTSVLWEDRYWEAQNGVFEMARSVAEGYARNGSLRIVDAVPAVPVEMPPQPQEAQSLRAILDARTAGFLASAGFKNVDDLRDVSLSDLTAVKYLPKKTARALHARFARSVD